MKHTIIFKNDTITLSKGQDGFWLYDYTRGMNLAMRSTSEQEALIESLMYYQKRLKVVEEDYKILYNKVDSFLGSIIVSAVE